MVYSELIACFLASFVKFAPVKYSSHIEYVSFSDTQETLIKVTIEKDNDENKTWVIIITDCDNQNFVNEITDFIMSA